MLDALYGLFAQLGPTEKKHYLPTQAIRSSIFRQAQSPTLTVAFLSWRSPWILRKTITSALIRTGTNVLVYDFNPYILNSDKDAVRDAFKYAADQIAREIANHLSTNKYSNVDLVGLSLGNLTLSMVADQLPTFRNVTMIVPGPNLAESFWYSWRTRRLRMATQRRGYTLAILASEWLELAPEWYAPIFSKHNVRIVLSKRDRFVPYQFGLRLVEKLKVHGAYTKLSLSPFGHVMTLSRAAKYLKAWPETDFELKPSNSTQTRHDNIKG